MASPALGYSAISKPHLWPPDTLQEARRECVKNLKSPRLKDETREAIRRLQAAIETTLAARNVRLRPVR